MRKCQSKKLLHKSNHQQNKKVTNQWKMIFANNGSDKVYIELIQLNTRKTNNSN